MLVTDAYWRHIPKWEGKEQYSWSYKGTHSLTHSRRVEGSDEPEGWTCASPKSLFISSHIVHGAHWCLPTTHIKGGGQRSNTQEATRGPTSWLSSEGETVKWADRVLLSNPFSNISTRCMLLTNAYRRYIPKRDGAVSHGATRGPTSRLFTDGWKCASSEALFVASNQVHFGRWCLPTIHTKGGGRRSDTEVATRGPTFWPCAARETVLEAP
jgi:hypothetical protein